MNRRPDPDAFSAYLLRLAADQKWPSLAIFGNALVPRRGERSWRAFLKGASKAEQMMAVHALRARARQNGRRKAALWQP